MNLSITLSNTKSGLNLTDTNHGDATQVIIRHLQCFGIYGVSPTEIKMPIDTVGTGFSAASIFNLEDGEGKLVSITIRQEEDSTVNCRDLLKHEGRAYPKSGCAVEGCNPIMGEKVCGGHLK